MTCIQMSGYKTEAELYPPAANIKISFPLSGYPTLEIATKAFEDMQKKVSDLKDKLSETYEELYFGYNSSSDDLEITSYPTDNTDRNLSHIECLYLDCNKGLFEHCFAGHEIDFKSDDPEWQEILKRLRDHFGYFFAFEFDEATAPGYWKDFDQDACKLAQRLLKGRNLA